MSPVRFPTVAVLGVGLIGASIGAAALRRRAATRILGVGRNRERLQLALDRGCITEIASLADAAAAADLIVACAPVGAIPSLLLDAAAACRPGALLTDAGSTKAEIVAAVEPRLPKGVNFIGGHPLAGSEKTGPAHADAELFVGRRVVLTPSENVDPDQLASLSAWWRALGAEVHLMEPAAHDRLAAAMSHAPHVVAAALAAATSDDVVPWTAGGWRDATRIAAGDVVLWRDILLANRSSVLQALDAFGKVLSRFADALSAGDAARLKALLEDAKSKRDAVGD